MCTKFGQHWYETVNLYKRQTNILLPYMYKNDVGLKTLKFFQAKVNITSILFTDIESHQNK